MEILPALSVGHVDDSTPQPAKQIDPLLAIGMARVLLSKDGMIEHGLTSLEVEPMVADVRLALLFIPDHHSRIV